jgi:hypothetical protein
MVNTLGFCEEQRKVLANNRDYGADFNDKYPELAPKICEKPRSFSTW